MHTLNIYEEKEALILRLLFYELLKEWTVISPSVENNRCFHRQIGISMQLGDRKSYVKLFLLSMIRGNMQELISNFMQACPVTF